MSDLVSNKSPSGSGSGVEGMPVGLTLTDSARVQGQGLGTALVWGQGEGVYPKKSLQWTRGLVNERGTMHLLLLNR